MTLWETLFAFLAVFLAVKAIEEAPEPLHIICSLGSWICAVVTVVLVLVGS